MDAHLTVKAQLLGYIPILIIVTCFALILYFLIYFIIHKLVNKTNSPLEVKPSNNATRTKSANVRLTMGQY